MRKRFRGVLRDDEGRPIHLEGNVVSKEDNFLFLKPDDFDSDIFPHVADTSETTWVQLKRGTRISFELGFTMTGPAGRAIRIARI